MAEIKKLTKLSLKDKEKLASDVIISEEKENKILDAFTKPIKYSLIVITICVAISLGIPEVLFAILVLIPILYLEVLIMEILIFKIEKKDKTIERMENLTHEDFEEVQNLITKQLIEKSES